MPLGSVAGADAIGTPLLSVSVPSRGSDRMRNVAGPRLVSGASSPPDSVPITAICIVATAHVSTPPIVPQAWNWNVSSPTKPGGGTYGTSAGRKGLSCCCVTGPSVPYVGPLPGTIEIVSGTPGGPIALRISSDGRSGGTSTTDGAAMTVVGGPGSGSPSFTVTTPSALKSSESSTRNVKTSFGRATRGV